MPRKVITLYVNDPMGGRCQRNLEAAHRAEEELGAQVVVIRKGSPEYRAEPDPPPCPSVAVDGRLVVRDGTADFERLRTELGKDR